MRKYLLVAAGVLLPCLASAQTAPATGNDIHGLHNDIVFLGTQIVNAVKALPQATDQSGVNAKLDTLHGDLHCQSAIEHHGDKRLNRHNLSKSSKCRIFSKRVASEAAVSLDQAFGAHVLERGLLHERKRWLSELRRRKKTGW